MRKRNKFETRTSGSVNYDIYMKYLKTLSVNQINALKIELITSANMWRIVVQGIILTLAVAIFTFILNGSIGIPSYIEKQVEIGTISFETLIFTSAYIVLLVLVLVITIYIFFAYFIVCKEKKVLIIDDFLKMKDKEESYVK